MDFPNSDFWNYSTQIWTLPEVEAICLELQNSHDANVSMLLYCCWVGDKKLNLNEDDIQVLLDTVQPWQTIIKPLRDSRKMMQQHLIAMPANMVDQTVNNITEMELNAEHMLQMALEKALNLKKITPCLKPAAEEAGIGCSLANLNTYIQSLENIPSASELTPQISQLLTSIYQDEESVQLALMANA